MHQKDTSIIQRSNVQSDAVVINQCDTNKIEEFDFINKKGKTCHVKFIHTTERGLSKSRNMAIRNAWGDICQLCDDDEYLSDDGEDKILEAYKVHPNASVIAFALIRNDLHFKKVYGTKAVKLSYKKIFNVGSLQITFKRKDILDKGVFFDEKIGSGTGNGGGEENKFLHDNRRKGHEMWYEPAIIATVNPGESQWFKGYDERFFENIGWVTRRSLGSLPALLYCLLWPARHRKLLPKEKNIFIAYKHIIKGYFQKR